MSDDDGRRRNTTRMVGLLQEMLGIVREQHISTRTTGSGLSGTATASRHHDDAPGTNTRPYVTRSASDDGTTATNTADSDSNHRPRPASAARPTTAPYSTRPPSANNNARRRQPAAAATLASAAMDTGPGSPDVEGFGDFNLHSSFTPRYASAMAEHRSLFQPLHSRRPGRRLNSNANSEQSRARATVAPPRAEKVLNRWFLCMHTIDACIIPTTALKSQLYDIGLGERLVSIGEHDDAAAVKQCLYRVFPRLEAAGGFEVLKVKEGSRSALEVIQVGSFPAAKLRSFGLSKLYLRPIQEDIIIEEGSREVEVEYCTECGASFAVNELRDHKEECLKINPMFLQTPDMSDELRPEQEPQLVQEEEELSSDVLVASIISIIDSIAGVEGAKEVLAEYCKGFLEGRRLDVDDNRESRMEGDVEEIFIDRGDIFKSAFSELMRASVNRRLTLKINLHGEQVEDLGGPRREILTLLHRHVGEHLFNDGNLVSNETFVTQRKFEFAGVICALCLLQGGPTPKFFGQDVVKEITLVGGGDLPREMKQFIKGLDIYGIVKLMDAKPEVRICFNKDVEKVVPLTVPGFLHLFDPIVHAANGSNKKTKELETLKHLTKWLREVKDGKRFFVKMGGGRDMERPSMTLGDVLRFITGCENIPLFGLSPTPTLVFLVRNPGNFYVTVSTCVNMLRLPIEENALVKKKEEDFFTVFDISFSSQEFQKETYDESA